MHMSKIFHAMFHVLAVIWSVAPFIFITDIFFDKISPEDTDTGDISLILMTLCEANLDDSVDSGQVTKFCSITVTYFRYSCFTVRVCVYVSP